MLRLEGDSAVDEDFGRDLRAAHVGVPKPPGNVFLQQAQDANFLFKSCCAERGLSSACQNRPCTTSWWPALW